MEELLYFIRNHCYHSGNFNLNPQNDLIEYQELESRDEIGNIYLWMEYLNGTPTRLLYVGKAGLTIKKRMKDHLGGFRNNENGRIIRNKLLMGSKIIVYAKYINPIDIYDVYINPIEAHEEALIIKFNPSLNGNRNRINYFRNINNII